MIGEVIHGDFLETGKKIPTESIDLIVTDPPYKLTQNYGSNIESDNLIAVAGIIRTLPEMARVLKSGRYIAIFYDSRILPFLFDSLKGTGLVYRKQIFLYRRWGNAHKNLGWMSCTDPCLIFQKGDGKFKIPDDVQFKHDCYVKSSPEDYNSGHPAQKPMEILQDIISCLSYKGELVLDPYSGSGTTLLAAKRLGRRFVGCEIKEEYCKICLDMVAENFNPSQEVLF